MTDYPECERVDIGELNKLRVHNVSFAEAKYLGEVTLFKTQVIELMRENEAIIGRYGWLIYQENPVTQSNVLVDDRGKETLIILQLADSAHFKTERPCIRIITNTEFRIQDGITAFLTEDITIDEDDDAQMLIDFIAINDNGQVLEGIDINKTSTSSSLFSVDTLRQVLRIYNFSKFTPILPISIDEDRQEYQGDPENFVIPFGYHGCLGDKVCALDWAKDIVQATKNATLIHKNVPKS